MLTSWPFDINHICEFIPKALKHAFCVPWTADALLCRQQTVRNAMSQPSNRWMTDSAERLGGEFKSANMALLDKFVEMGIPVLKRYKSGFLAETGDILTCLLIHVEDSGGLRVQVCHIDDYGQLQSRTETVGGKASNVVKAFVMDFPEAVLTTSAQKPLCLFAKKSTPDTSKSEESSDPADLSLGDPNLHSLGMFQGYMSFMTFQRIVSDQSQKITVAVP